MMILIVTACPSLPPFPRSWRESMSPMQCELPTRATPPSSSHNRSIPPALLVQVSEPLRGNLGLHAGDYRFRGAIRAESRTTKPPMRLTNLSNDHNDTTFRYTHYPRDGNSSRGRHSLRTLKGTCDMVPPGYGAYWGVMRDSAPMSTQIHSESYLQRRLTFLEIHVAIKDVLRAHHGP
jgi:hypothetical protein